MGGTEDGNYIVAGATNSFGNEDQVYLVKLANLNPGLAIIESQSLRKQVASNNTENISPSYQPGHVLPKKPFHAIMPAKQPKRAKALSK